ncbi:hypothetical protein E2C01_018567 [Portunus trituberculatus]|uniref:Uncharacterized protein n=1 Tax=Portunus trituberculatus TaxID=210409 RepID=A0A5B7DWX1_PORTR|nr:hypothetical protein [Portunus trituberculatus]
MWTVASLVVLGGVACALFWSNTVEATQRLLGRFFRELSLAAENGGPGNPALRLIFHLSKFPEVLEWRRVWSLLAMDHITYHPSKEFR